MYNLIGYSDAYLKTSGSLWQSYRDEPDLHNNGEIIDLSDNTKNASLKFIQKIAEQTGNGGTKDVEIMVPSKYLSNFRRTLEIPSINCEISLQLKWSKKCIRLAGTANNQNPSFHINDTKRYVPIVI